MPVVAIPGLLALLGGFFKIFALYAVTRILLALGLSYWVISGFDDLKDSIYLEITTNYGNLTAASYQILTMAGVDQAITIIFSCVTVRLIMNGLANGIIGGIAFKGITSGS